LTSKKDKRKQAYPVIHNPIPLFNPRAGVMIERINPHSSG